MSVLFACDLTLHHLSFDCYDLYLQPEMQSRYQKEGVESEQFWELLGGKSEYKNRKFTREAESDPHLFECTLSNGMYSFLF